MRTFASALNLLTRFALSASPAETEETLEVYNRGQPFGSADMLTFRASFLCVYSSVHAPGCREILGHHPEESSLASERVELWRR